MGDEFKLSKDLATISATAIELAAVNRLITQEISSQEFLAEYDDLLLDIVDTYWGLDNFLRPVFAINSEQAFIDQFSTVVNWYSEHYQPALSQPRINAEFTFQKYLQFRKRRETKTSYPLLRIAFSRLHDFIDKWIDNDIWLALTIDAFLKTLNRLLIELAETAKKDQEQAYVLFSSTTAGTENYLCMIQDAIHSIETTRRHAVAADAPQPLSQSH